MQRVDDSGTTQDTYLSEINYRVDGLISSQRLGNGATESFGYSDDRLQLTSQTVTNAGNTLLSLNYGYQAGAGQMGSLSTAGNSGQLVSVNGTVNGQSRNQEFTYDNVGKLITATGWGAWERKFDYDRQGNRTAVWGAVSGGNPLQNIVIGQANGMTTNRIASVNGTAFSYDASGNMTGDGARAYTYDAVNRLVSVSEPGSESYGYDAGNRRVRKVVGGVVTHYVWEGNQVIAEYERGGGATQSTGTRYYHQDRLSTRVITDGAGAVVGTMEHLPFGEEIGGSDEREKHKFTTYERDGTGLDYAVNRHYDPQRGRFNQVDPLRMGASSLTDPQSLNLYSYVQNDPVNSVDPSGLLLYQPKGSGGGGTINMGTTWARGPWWDSFPNFGVGLRGLLGLSGPMPLRTPVDDDRVDGDGPQQPNKSGRGGSSDGNVPAGTTGGTNKPCANLARNAQRTADFAIENNGGVADSSAVEEFDAVLSWLYVGTRIDTYQHARDADRNMDAEGKRVVGSSVIGRQDGWGQRDFKDKFQEPSSDGSINPANDQTHHAVAFVSAGINNMGGIALGHMLIDDNTPDKLLGGQSFQIGANLRYDPTGLRTIGADIRRLLCK
jgi:RHS repeat-associated protein